MVVRVGDAGMGVVVVRLHPDRRLVVGNLPQVDRRKINQLVQWILGAPDRAPAPCARRATLVGRGAGVENGPGRRTRDRHSPGVQPRRWATAAKPAKPPWMSGRLAQGARGFRTCHHRDSVRNDSGIPMPTISVTSGGSRS